MSTGLTYRGACCANASEGCRPLHPGHACFWSRAMVPACRFKTTVSTRSS